MITKVTNSYSNKTYIALLMFRFDFTQPEQNNPESTNDTQMNSIDLWVIDWRLVYGY